MQQVPLQPHPCLACTALPHQMPLIIDAPEWLHHHQVLQSGRNIKVITAAPKHLICSKEGCGGGGEVGGALFCTPALKHTPGASMLSSVNPSIECFSRYGNGTSMCYQGDTFLVKGLHRSRGGAAQHQTS